MSGRATTFRKTLSQRLAKAKRAQRNARVMRRLRKRLGFEEDKSHE